MVQLQIGVVDVFVVDPSGPFRVLLLRRGPGTRCTGAWEVVHGRIEEGAGERPEEAARREVHEETGLPVRALYNVTCHPFYLHRHSTVQLAVVFAAVADSSLPVLLGDEHDAWEWVPMDVALDRLAWPRSRHTLRDIRQLLEGGDAGPVEDVLRVF
jgi:8-oxo-dGTP pyrophosphatase MutT (NUDIX family)